MAVFAQDSFTDTDATNLADHTGETGATWTKLTGFTGDATIDANTLINSASEAAYYAGGSPASADYDVSVDYSWEDSSFANLKIMGRVDVVTGDHYTLHYARSDGVYRLQKYVSGSLTTLASSSQSLLAEGAYRNHKLAMSGENLEGFAAGTSRVSTSDASISAAGKAGLRLSAGTTTRLRLDNFLAEDGSAGGGDDEVDPDSTSHGHTAGNATVTQIHDVSVASASHGHTAENATVAQNHVLDVASAAHGHSAENVDISQNHALDVADASHGHAAENVTLTVAGDISPDNTSHPHTAETATVTQAHDVAIDGASHTHTADNVTLGVAGELQPANARHAHTAAQASLSQIHVVAIDGTSHGHTAGNVTVIEGVTVNADNASHGHTADNVDLEQLYQLVIAGASHSHTADSVALAQAHFLAAHNARHAHTAENVITVETSDAAPPHRTIGIGRDNRTMGIGARTRVINIER